MAKDERRPNGSFFCTPFYYEQAPFSTLLLFDNILLCGALPNQHISKFAKHFKDFKQPSISDEATFQRIAEVIMTYFGRIHRQHEGVQTAPTRETIAILPMYEVR